MNPLSVNKPHLIIMVGIPGAGKSFFAEHFADTFKSPIISFDNLRSNLSDSPKYDKEEDEIIKKIADYILNETLKTGRTIIFEGQSDTRIERAVMAKKAKDAGYEPMFIWVQTEQLTAKRRSTKSSDGKQKMSSDKFDAKFKKFNAPTISEKPIVISGKHTYTSQLKIVLRSLAEPRTETVATQVIKPTPIDKPPRSRNYLIR